MVTHTNEGGSHDSLAGIDLSLRSVNICVVYDDGEYLAESKLSSDVQEIIAYLDELECARCYW